MWLSEVEESLPASPQVQQRVSMSKGVLRIFCGCGLRIEAPQVSRE